MTKPERLSVSKIISIIAAILVCIAITVVLGIYESGDVKVAEVLPKLGKEPVYVELLDGEAKTFSYTADVDYNVRRLEMVLVNTDVAESSGEASVKVSVAAEGSAEVLGETEFLLTDIEAGSWSKIPLSFLMEKGKTYTFTYTAMGCNPYFMDVPGYEMGISTGFEVIEDEHVTYAEKLPYLVPALILLTVLFVLYVIYGNSLFVGAYEILSSDKFKAVWNVAFLVALFVAIALRIYQEGYMDGVWISADSDGYLREAVNLVHGNGFSYEGLAGYDSYFASWPIIYPALIAAAMLVTGTNAYLASKFVAILVVAVIFITLWFEFKGRAWLYALAFTNVGFLTLCFYTWSEVPFIWFLLMFALELARIVSKAQPGIRPYVLLGVFGTAVFLTRYFGIYAWFVAGFYWLVLLVQYIKGKRAGRGSEVIRRKLTGLFISAAASGVLCFGYLVMNKIKNGYPTGVSRGTWWDDYKTLTIDLFNSLVVEVFNVFSLSVPAAVDGMHVALKVVFVALVIAVLAVVIKKNLPDGIMNRGAVLVVMAVFYYVMFIIVRYRSSMDTFYFRFFAPATVLLVLGVIDLVVRDTETARKILMVLAAFVSVVVIANLADGIVKAANWKNETTYYDITTAEWDEAYKEIPAKSAIIWNDIDYRSSWYRPDVYNGELEPSDSWQSVTDRYSGSDYICMKKEDAQAVIESGEYENDLTRALEDAVNSASAEAKYVVIK